MRSVEGAIILLAGRAVKTRRHYTMFSRVSGAIGGRWRNIPITLKIPSMSEMACSRQLMAGTLP
jgi:hypothetical protein